ncbi:hypothetical protein QAD02_014254 [Eretmocerus hayati]|uniref:Uncharacterized protein n=1 Tax=Eretmocerus hayati TaxID=131215 RepID=A0ACC2P508_9HYME|nr:hypothetical protein QAD02_014254 [Eretmocerus hayati]
MFGTRTETGNVIIPNTVKTGHKDLSIDTGRNGHGQKQSELGIFGTRTETGNATIPNTGENGQCFLFCPHGQKRVMLSYWAQAKTGEKACALTRIETDTGENGLHFVPCLYGQKRARCQEGACKHTDVRGSSGGCIHNYKTGAARHQPVFHSTGDFRH